MDDLLDIGLWGIAVTLALVAFCGISPWWLLIPGAAIVVASIIWWWI